MPPSYLQNQVPMYSGAQVRLDDQEFTVGGDMRARRQAGENIHDWLKSCYKSLAMRFPKFHKMDEQCRLGILLAEAVVDEYPQAINREQTGVILINRSASIYTDTIFYNSYASDSQSLASPSRFVYTLPNIVIGEISIRHKLLGEHAFFVQEEIDSEFLYLYVDSLFEEQVLDTVFIGVTDVSKAGVIGTMRCVSNQDLAGTEKLSAADFADWLNDGLRNKK